MFRIKYISVEISRGEGSFLMSKSKDLPSSSRNVLEGEVGIDLEEAWINDTQGSFNASFLD